MRKQIEIEHLKASGLQDKALYGYTFDKDNGMNPEMKLAQLCKQLGKMKSNSSRTSTLGGCRYRKIFLCRMHR